MTDPSSVAAVARALGDDSRAAMCLALLDGAAWTVSELADRASVGLPTASDHVARLARAGLVDTQTQGRCKYVRLAGPDVAALVEALARLGELDRTGSLRAVRERQQFAAARTCYDHLAGRLGVAVFDAMCAQRLLHRRDGLALTRRGRSFLAGLDVDLAALDGTSRATVRDCLDVTERRPHLAGAAGAAVCSAFADHGWVRRRRGSRTLEVTPLGSRALVDLLGVGPADLAPTSR